MTSLMNLPWMTVATFGLLAASICSVWLKPINLGGRFHIAPWAVLFAVSIAAGCFAGHLTYQSVLALGALVGSAHLASIATHQVLRVFARVLTGLIVLALYMNLFPGFVDVTLAKNMVVSDNGQPFTHHAKFGPIATGLILMVYFCNPVKSVSEWKALLRQVAPIVCLTLVCVLGLALVLRYIEPDIKLTAYTATYLVVNLLFVCVAEEAFFRGFLQEQLSRAMSQWRVGVYIASLVGIVLFGFAHARGGPVLVLLATIAGGFYTYAYLKTKRVEAAILTHFSLNAVHFLAFTYPRLQN